MMNGVYELRPDEAWASKLKSGQLPEYLKPSNKIQQQLLTIATAMVATTLWVYPGRERSRSTRFSDCCRTIDHALARIADILRRSEKDPSID